MAEALGARAAPAPAARTASGARPGARRESARSESPRSESPRSRSVRRDGAPLKDEALRLLAGTQKTRLPRKRKGLIAVLDSHFSKKVPESELQGLVDELIAQGTLSEAKGAITYHL
jgi:hypothetical protein